MKNTLDTRTKLLLSAAALLFISGLINLFGKRYSLAAINFSTATCLFATVNLYNRNNDNEKS